MSFENKPYGRIALVGCSKRKVHAKNIAASQLYTGSAFRAAKGYVHRTCRRYYILSAQHGLLSPSEQIGYYDKYIGDMNKGEIKLWANNAARAIRKSIAPGSTIEFLCGKRYWQYIVPLLKPDYAIELPLQHLRQGEQTKWLRHSLGTDRKPRIPFVAVDFTIKPDDTPEIAFAKSVCFGLKKRGLPDWVNMEKVYFANRGWYHTKHGGPTLGTPVKKFNHIHYIYPSHLVIGFQFEEYYTSLPSELSERWDEFQVRLHAATGVKYMDTAKELNWPRLQFRHYYHSLSLDDRGERRLLINNTKTALEIAGEVFGW